MENSELSFGPWLKRLRRSRDLTQEELADRIGCALVTLHKIETEDRRPSKEIAQRLAEALCVPESDRAAFIAFARASYPEEIPPPLVAIQPTVPIHQGRPSADRPLRSHNLPAQLTSFVGREREMPEIASLLDATRLLTLTGAGGSGKTRLGLEVAGRLTEDFRDGVWLADLARLADPNLVPQAIAAALGVRDEGLRPLLDQLSDYCQPRALLLLLDNCEHLIDACAAVAHRLLSAAPDLKILATSREPMGIGGEITFVVPTLAVPDPGSLPPLDALMRFDAIRLFTERARIARPDFALTEANGAAVAEICRRLDGMPLAIELAASRIRLLPVEEIRARLADRFELLTGGSRIALPRHQTLRATIEWSYALLTEPERGLLRRLAVFAGGWTLQAAEVVCGVHDDAAQPHVLDLMARLADKSLVVPEWRGRLGRYGMLETLRQFASGAARTVRRGRRYPAAARGLFRGAGRGGGRCADGTGTEGLAGPAGRRAQQHPGCLRLACLGRGPLRAGAAGGSCVAHGRRALALLGGARPRGGRAGAAPSAAGRGRLGDAGDRTGPRPPGRRHLHLVPGRLRNRDRPLRDERRTLPRPG